MHGRHINQWQANTLEREAMKTNEAKNRRAQEQPFRVRLPGFITHEEMGLGEVIQRVTYAMGVRTCKGCENRAIALNRWITFHGKTD
jgi:hypothetical protein